MMIPDQIINWNNVYLQVIRVNAGAPTFIARSGAIMHLAMYNAVNAIEKTHKPYPATLNLMASAGASKEAAAIYAAYTVLTGLYLKQNTLNSGLNYDLDRELRRSERALIRAGQTSESIAKGKLLGEQAAQAIFNERRNDGTEKNIDVTDKLNIPKSDPPYPLGGQPGDWRPTGSGDAVTPNWGSVKPFVIPSGAQFRPPLPGGFRSKADLLLSPEYAAQVNEVKRLGSFDSKERTPEQTEIALFWANDLDGTSKPPGQLYTITEIVSVKRGLSFSENARLYALVALALADAGVVAWSTKYDTQIDLWRPESAIQRAFEDGNFGTIADTTWQPLSPRTDGRRFSPPFPAYISGHATFGAAHSAILRNFFGTDNITFTATTEDPHAIDLYNVPLTRTFNSFSSAALENGRSRVYLGVHYQWDADNGYISGTNLADFVFANALQKL